MTAQRGNILFLILLTVVLFAALSYAVTSSMRGGGNNADPEVARAAAADLTGFATLAENTVQRLALQVPHQNIQYGAATNSGCTNTACRLSDPAGGGLKFPPISAQYLIDPSIVIDSSRGNRWQIRMIQIDGIGTDKPEIALMTSGIKEDICRALNEGLGVPMTSGAVPRSMPAVNNSGLHNFTDYASYTPDDVLSVTAGIRYNRAGSGSNAPQVQYRRAFCACENTTCSAAEEWRYQYWHVLIAQ